MGCGETAGVEEMHKFCLRQDQDQVRGGTCGPKTTPNCRGMDNSLEEPKTKSQKVQDSKTISSTNDLYLQGLGGFKITLTFRGPDYQHGAVELAVLRRTFK
jgi:hypothetical protein